MSGSRFDWADDVIEEAAMQSPAPAVSKNEITLEDLMAHYDGVASSSVTSIHEEGRSNDDFFSGNMFPEPKEEQRWTATEALAQGKFDEWANNVIWNLNEGHISYRRVFLPKHLEGWRGAELLSTSTPADNHLTAVDPSKMNAKMPYLERSYMGCLTYESFAHRASQQKSMRKVGIAEKEVPLSDSDKLKVVLPKFNRWICRPTGMRNSWTMA